MSDGVRNQQLEEILGKVNHIYRDHEEPILSSDVPTVPDS